MMTAADLQKLREGFIEDAVAAAEVLGVHPETVNRRAKQGIIREYKKGGTYYYSRREVEQFAK